MANASVSSSNSDDEIAAGVDPNGESHVWSTHHKIYSKNSIERRLEAVEYSKKFGKRQAARHFKVNKKSIRDWCHAEEKLLEAKNRGKAKCVRLEGCGRKESFPLLEQQLTDWIDCERGAKRRVSRKMLYFKAKEFFSEMQRQGMIGLDVKFGFSSGWLMRFMHRKNLTLRQKTTTCQKAPAHYVEKLVNFFLYVRQIRLKNQYPYNSIIAADETAVWFDSLSNKTVDYRGVHDVALRSTGHEKARLTVMLSAKSDGFKLKPFLLLERKRPVAELERFKSKLEIVYCGKSWMDDPLTVTYLHKVLGFNLFCRRLLVWDSFRCHISELVKAELKKLKIDIAVVPGGCTKFVQAPDVAWNKPFKEKIREYYDSWMMAGDKEFTLGGNIKAAPLPIVCQWIVDAWASLSTDMIAKSFKSCGITVDVDGSEDDLISCFKEGRDCESGLALLKSRWNEIKSDDIAPVDGVAEEEPLFSASDNSSDEEIVSAEH